VHKRSKIIKINVHVLFSVRNMFFLRPRAEAPPKLQKSDAQKDEMGKMGVGP